MEKMNKVMEKQAKKVFYAGAVTACLFLAYSAASILIMMFLKGGYPETAKECFLMIEENRLLALLRLDIISVAVIPFYAVLFFSIYYAVKKDSQLASGIAIFLVLGGIIVFMSTVNLASILNIAEKYLNTESEELRNLYLAACEGMLADDMWINTGYVYRGLLIELGAIIFSVMMIRSSSFTKPVGWIGLVTHCFDFGSIVMGLWFPAVKNIFIIIAGPLYIVWFILLGLQLSRLPERMQTE